MTSASTMRGVVVTPSAVEVTDLPIPVPGAGEASVRTVVAGVCGSDTHAAHGRHPFIALPYRPGHEVVGVVDAVGPDTDDSWVGRRVTVEPTLPCWTCKMCTTGRENLCENLRFFGCGWEQGGMAERFTVPVDRLHAVPDELDDRAAALIEPLSTPVHAVGLAGDVSGKAVVVLGAGTIGLLVLRVLKAAGVEKVVVTDTAADKRERALRLGADAAVDAAAPDAVDQVRAALGESADAVWDCVAVPATIAQAIALADKAGTVLVVGVPTGDVTIPLAIIQDHQIRIQGCATYLPADYERSVELLVTGAVRADDIVTTVLPLEEAATAFATSGSPGEVKVLVTVGS